MQCTHPLNILYHLHGSSYYLWCQIINHKAPEVYELIYDRCSELLQAIPLVVLLELSVYQSTHGILSKGEICYGTQSTDVMSLIIFTNSLDKRYFKETVTMS